LISGFLSISVLQKDQIFSNKIRFSQTRRSALEQLAERWQHPLLKELVMEASQALARLNAERLEELALSCQALNRDLAGMDGDARAVLLPQAQAAAKDMAVFARVLDATCSNLELMNRLRERRRCQLEYRATPRPEWRPAESDHGNN
jgi:hypothetical protein